MSAQTQSRLSLETLDMGLIDAWIDEGARRNPGTHVEIHSPHLLEDCLTEVAEAVTDILNRTPSDDADRPRRLETPEGLRRIGRQLEAGRGAYHVIMLREQDGRISAFTDAESRPNHPYVGQRLRGVVQGYEGRGRARWIKAEMMRHVLKAVPWARYIATENASTNGRMLAINYALGFRPDRVKAIYQVDRQAVADWLDRSARRAPTAGLG